MEFTELEPHPSLATALAARGYATATPVQELILSPANAGRDLLVSAQTGSGKTVAFGLALAPEILGDAARFGRAREPLALVVAPTRELALQVQQELSWLYAGTGARICSCVGGMDPRREQRILADGAHIVVGTPGRLCDHLDRKNLKLGSLKVAVLDEADEMLDMGFRDELERILHDAPTERRTLMLSATLPSAIVEIARKYQRDALRLSATPARAAHADIEYRAHLVAPRELEHAIVNTLRRYDPSGALVFCATRDGVNHLQANLAERGFLAVAISGELTQPERLRALQALRDGRARVLVATDVAARGLDLPALDLVIQSDLPRDPQVLQHRSGRTGRAGRKGVSVVLVPIRFRSVAERLFRSANVKPTWAPVTSAEEIRALDQDRLIQAIGALCEQAGEEDLAVAKRLLVEKDPEQLVAALVRQQRGLLPAPEDLPATAAMAKAPSRAHAHELPTRPQHTRGAPFRPRTQGDAPSFERPSHPRSRPGHPGRPEHTGRPERGPRREEPTSGVWFRLNVGRLNNADPRWLIPLICRRGGTVKADIGKIVILPKETRFLVSDEAADRFEASATRPDKKDPAIRIQRVLERKK